MGQKADVLRSAFENYLTGEEQALVRRKRGAELEAALAYYAAPDEHLTRGGTIDAGAAKAHAEKDDDGDLRVNLTLGTHSAVGCMSEDARVWLTPEAADYLAEELRQAARKVRDENR